MSILSHILIIAFVLAAIFVPQILSIHFSEWRNTEGEEYIPDGR